jgi:hypothetical protein
MGFIARLVLFALGLTVLLGGYRIVEKVRGRDDRRVIQVDLPEPPDVPAVAERVAAPARVAVLEMPAAPEVALPPLHAGEVRIITTNRAAFMALRGDQIVAGLSDSMLRHIQVEMKRELRKENVQGVGAAIGKAAADVVSKILEKEITVPVTDVRDISYDGRRIVIKYRNGEPSGMINLETIKSEGDRTVLEQFSAADARRFVEAVKVRVK